MSQLGKGVLLIAATVLMFVVGCMTTHTTDIASLQGHERFEWNGRVMITKSYKGLFQGWTVDFVELGAKDGRSMFLDTRGHRIEPSIKTKIQIQRMKTDWSPSNKKKGGQMTPQSPP